MKFLTLSAYVALLCSVASAAVISSPLRTVEKTDGAKTGRYIIKLKDGVSRSSVLKKIRLSGNTTTDWTVFNGFSGELDTASLDLLRASADVESIAEDGYMYITAKTTQ